MERKIAASSTMPARPARAPETKLAPSSGRAAVALTAPGAGMFEGYASLFHIQDLGGDIVMPGAFAASLRRRGPGAVKLLWQHDASQPLGLWEAIEEDDRGLRVKGRLNLAVARAREILSLMHDGVVDGLSIGYRTVQSRRDGKAGPRRLYKVDLWEISLVTFPMLPQARVQAVKRGAQCLDGDNSERMRGHIVCALRRTASLMR